MSTNWNQRSGRAGGTSSSQYHHLLADAVPLPPHPSSQPSPSGELALPALDYAGNAGFQMRSRRFSLSPRGEGRGGGNVALNFSDRWCAKMRPDDASMNHFELL